MTFTINGRRFEAALEPRVTLLDALRNHLDLTGAKKVCDRAACGACTVLVGGKPVYSCTLLAIEAQAAEITTVEGLGTPDRMHPIQAAFVENDAQQCGYCTPGFVVACKAFLDANPDPSPAEIERGLGGNLCRCGTYDGIKHVLLAGGKPSASSVALDGIATPEPPTGRRSRSGAAPDGSPATAGGG
jgi:xanthine dehydrogenase YagT iron-sulfur-binding subunit